MARWLTSARHKYHTLAVLVVLISFLAFLTYPRPSSRSPHLKMASANTPVSLNDGNTIPWLGFGTGTALYSKDAEALVASAIKLGITHLDGAQVYNNEDSLGAGLISSGVPRSKLFVTTKLGKVPAGQSVRDTLVESLKKLKLDFVDLYLIHSPGNHPGEGVLKKVWAELEGLKKEGLAKTIGVSNFNISNLKEVLDGNAIPPAINQVL